MIIFYLPLMLSPFTREITAIMVITIITTIMVIIMVVEGVG